MYRSNGHIKVDHCDKDVDIIPTKDSLSTPPPRDTHTPTHTRALYANSKLNVLDSSALPTHYTFTIETSPMLILGSERSSLVPMNISQPVCM